MITITSNITTKPGSLTQTYEESITDFSVYFLIMMYSTD